MRIVGDAQEAQYLTQLEHLVFLEPFMGEAISITEAAQKAQVNVQKMFYQVGKMQRAGLLHLVRTEKRSGKTTKLFSTSSEAYFVPLTVTPMENLTAFFRSSATVMLEEQAMSQAKTLLRNKSDGDFGFRIEKVGQDVNFNLAPLETPNPERSTSRQDNKTWRPEEPMIAGFGRFRISRQKAETIRQLLRQLDETEEDEDGTYYIYRVAFTPEEA